MIRTLEGIRVLDLGQYLAGPFGPMILADLGADVIKVEPVTGDAMRMAPKPFFGCQRGKRSIAVDLKHTDGVAIAVELVATADVVHHNMTAGVADRLGVGVEACRAVNPEIVYCDTRAYGLDGPFAAFGGLDPLFQASGGLEHEAGAVTEGNAPLYLRFGMCDAGNAMLSVVGVLAALLHRRRAGAGQALWTSLLDAGALFSGDALLAGPGAAAPERPRLDAGLHGLGPWYRLYDTAGAGWIQVAAVTPTQREAMRTVLEHDGDGDGDGRVLSAAFADRFRTRTAAQWHDLLDDAGVPNEIPLDPQAGDAMLFDADNVALGLVATYEHPVLGRMRQFGTLVGFSETPGHIAGPPPLVGEHTREILRELGRDDAAIDALREAGVVYEPDPGLVDYRTRFAV